MSRPTKFEIRGLFGDRNISLEISSNSLVLVGPNGVGKSIVINIFYFFISRQWDRLLQYTFTEVAIWFGNSEIRARRSDISGLSGYSQLLRAMSAGPRSAIWLDRLKMHGLLEQFLTARRPSRSDLARFASALDTTATEARLLRMSILNRAERNDLGLFEHTRIAIENELSRFVPNRTLYLPTYRRIERDLQEIFPRFEERLRLEGPGTTLVL